MKVVKETIRHIYQVHNPSKLPDVDELEDEWEGEERPQCHCH